MTTASRSRHLRKRLLAPSALFAFHPAMSDDLLPDLLAAVEQQLVSPQTKYVAKTLERLLKAGLDETGARQQLALCLGEQMDAMTRSKHGFDEKAYRTALDELPLEEESAEEE